MEPRADGLAVLDCVRAPGQGQERIPEGVLDVVLRRRTLRQTARTIGP